MGGEPVFGNQFTVNEELRELAGNLERLEQLLDQAGIDVADMSNAEIRAAIRDIEVYDQLGDDDVDIDVLDELTRAAVTSATHDPVMLTKIAAMLPELAMKQEFGDVKLKVPVIHKGKAGARVTTAQKEFDRTVKRKGILEKLMDCVNG
jgi:hypothetical protein